KEALRIQGKLVAAALVGVIGSAFLTGCGTGVSLSGVDVHDGTKLKTSSGIVNVDNKNGTVFPYAGGTGGAEHRSVSSGGGGMQSVSDYGDGSRVIDNVPFFKQGPALQADKSSPDNTCAQAATTVVLKYWQGQNGPDYQTVVNESNKFNMATTHSTVTNYLKAKGMNVNAYKNGTLNHLKTAVDAGHPTIVLMQFDVPHYVVVIGYNDEQGKIIYHDSIDGPNQQMDEGEFNAKWHNSEMAKMPIIGGANYVGLTIEAQL
ncbi:MAG: C39 family peptidase, partial [Candidatus Sericytochromatia bacterium]|nr:C39 family peptidase [Candidatus Tanganyikabacteria bacterium]